MKTYNLTVSMTNKTEESLRKQYPHATGIIEIIDILFNEKLADVEVESLQTPNTIIRDFLNNHLKPEE